MLPSHLKSQLAKYMCEKWITNDNTPSLYQNYYYQWAKDNSANNRYYKYNFFSECDYPVEIFVNKHGEVLRPYKMGVAFKSCKIERWYNPDCIPGIVSVILPTNTKRINSHLVVLFTGDLYIELQPQQELITDRHVKSLCERHFRSRGLEHLDDTSILPFELFGYQKDIIDANRPRTNPPYDRSYYKDRRRVWDDAIDFGRHKFRFITKSKIGFAADGTVFTDKTGLTNKTSLIAK